MMTISTRLPGSVRRDPETRGLRVAVFPGVNPGCGPCRRCTSAGASQAARARPGRTTCRRRADLPAVVWTAKVPFPLSLHLGGQDRRLPWSPGLVRAADGSTGRSSSPSPFSCRVPATAEALEPVQRTWPGWDVQLSIKTHLNQLYLGR